MQDHGNLRALSSELQNGDEVEVLTSEAQSAPPSHGSRSRSPARRGRDRRATRTAAAINMPGLGRRIVEAAVRNAQKIEYADDKLKGALPRLAARLDRRRDAPRSAAAEMKASDVAARDVSRYKVRTGARYAPSEPRG